MLDTFNKNYKLLLHCCCAPCSGAILELLLSKKINYTVFFYNPNIHPTEEYLLRKQSLLLFAQKLKINFINCDYNPKEEWLNKVIGLEQELEGKLRCIKCFNIRLAKTAYYAFNNNYQAFATTLSISQWKNKQNILSSGKRAASKYQDLKFLDVNWANFISMKNKNDITMREKFYRQKYCGCLFSKDNNFKKTNASNSKLLLYPIRKI